MRYGSFRGGSRFLPWRQLMWKYRMLIRGHWSPRRAISGPFHLRPLATTDVLRGCGEILVRGVGLISSEGAVPLRPVSGTAGVRSGKLMVNQTGRVWNGRLVASWYGGAQTGRVVVSRKGIVRNGRLMVNRNSGGWHHIIGEGKHVENVDYKWSQRIGIRFRVERFHSFFDGGCGHCIAESWLAVDGHMMADWYPATNGDGGRVNNRRRGSQYDHTGNVGRDADRHSLQLNK